MSETSASPTQEVVSELLPLSLPTTLAWQVSSHPKTVSSLFPLVKSLSDWIRGFKILPSPDHAFLFHPTSLDFPPRYPLNLMFN